jgi:hypothetical protein
MISYPASSLITTKYSLKDEHLTFELFHYFRWVVCLMHNDHPLPDRLLAHTFECEGDGLAGLGRRYICSFALHALDDRSEVLSVGVRAEHNLIADFHAAAVQDAGDDSSGVGHTP